MQPALSSIPVLYVRRDSIYKTITSNAYDDIRDARTYTGTSAIVAHPPCRAWGNYSHKSKHTEAEKAMALHALAHIQRHGGILEHPRTSRLWPEQQLPQPGTRDDFGGITIPLLQNWYGHPAPKMTYLYIVGLPRDQLPRFPLTLETATKRVENQSRAQRERTPPDLARYLVALAEQIEARKP